MEGVTVRRKSTILRMMKVRRLVRLRNMFSYQTYMILSGRTVVEVCGGSKLCTGQKW